MGAGVGDQSEALVGHLAAEGEVQDPQTRGAPGGDGLRREVGRLKSQK